MGRENRSALVTGANVGLGKEVARQLALTGGFQRIYLGCRDVEKARAARADLKSATGADIFGVVELDLLSVPSVVSAIDSLDGPVHSLVMNAGGVGGPTPLELTAQRVTQLFAANVLGHVELLEELILRKALTSTAVLAGSEAAAGAPRLRIPRPTFADNSVAEFCSVIDGSYFDAHKFSGMLAYGQAKYLGALWMSALARRHPELRLLTMSPGNTSGTKVLRDSGNIVTRTLLQRVVFPYVLAGLGMSHNLKVGARRLVDATLDAEYRSGMFYASAPGKLTGPVVPQAADMPELADPVIQDHAYEAIHRFVSANGLRSDAREDDRHS